MSEHAKESLCWTCKHGVCIKEASKELIMPLLESPGPQEVQEAWQRTEEDKMSELLPIDVEREAIKAICFWRPSHVSDAPPILVANVKECSRFAPNE